MALLNLSPIPVRTRMRRLARGIFWLLLAIGFALSWMLFPYFLNGRQVLGDVGYSIQAERMSRSTATARLLIRNAEGPGDADVDVLYATTEYLTLIDPSGAARKYEPSRYLIFFVTETAHVGVLPADAPSGTLLIDGREIAPADIEGPRNIQHHRASVIRFSLVDVSEAGMNLNVAKKIELRLSSTWNNHKPSTRTVSWELPISYPPGTSDRGLWSLALVASLSAGLLSAVLTPCLIQLVIVYLAAVASVGSGNGSSRTETKRTIIFALSFIIGFSALYTVAGAVIGHFGHQSQMLFAAISRPAALISGTIIILLALWTALKTDAPMVCRLPASILVNKLDGAGLLRAVLTAGAFSFGCITCFGGAIVGTLLVYVGTVGSASVGAAIMLLFSIGVAIPFLIAALALSRAERIVDQITNFRPWANLAASAIMAVFGLILITDNFHTVSDWIYPYLNVSRR